MTATYEAIATTTLTTTATSVSFTSISGSFTDLILVMQVDLNAAGNQRFRLNSDTGSNYSFTILYGNGSSAGSVRDSSTSGLMSYQAEADTTLGNSMQIAHFMNYSNSTTYKTVLCRADRAGTGTDAIVNLWRNTNAITSIEIATGVSFGGTFQSGSTFTLYGIKAE